MDRFTSKTKSFRSLLLSGGIIGGLIVLFAIVFEGGIASQSGVDSDLKNPPARSATATGEVSSDRDYSDTRLSDHGLFQVSYVTSNGEIPINQMHQWTLHVETKDGQPVEGATITVDGDMPEHGHGLPTRPEVTRYLGHGDYLVEGMKFQMGGFWVMDFAITTNDQSDVVHFELSLP